MSNNRFRAEKEGCRRKSEGLTLFPEEEVVPYLPQFVREQEETVSGTTRGSALQTAGDFP
ncbi:MAG: hypothetical protein ACLURV_10755 [Gallintestinimicrobium sp.]